jgi:hypothetical protein
MQLATPIDKKTKTFLKGGQNDKNSFKKSLRQNYSEKTKIPKAHHLLKNFLRPKHPSVGSFHPLTLAGPPYGLGILDAIGR